MKQSDKPQPLHEQDKQNGNKCNTGLYYLNVHTECF